MACKRNQHQLVGQLPFTCLLSFGEISAKKESNRLEDPRSELLARYLRSGETIENELALLASQPMEKQLVVENRLKIIDQYLTGPSQSLAQAEAAASQIGVAKRRFYRLLAKLRMVGPTRALAPGFRNVARVSQSRHGLHEAVEASIRKVLALNPDARIAEIEEFVRAEGGFGDAGLSESAIRRRVHALRASADSGSNRNPFGQKFVVDQIVWDRPVQWGIAEQKTTLSILTLIIDKGTKLICGFALTVQDGSIFGLEQALFDASRRIASFEEAPLAVAAQVRELTWVVPAGAEEVSEAVPLAIPPENGDIVLKQLSSGPRRHGDAIMRLIGDKLGVYPFRRLAQMGEVAPTSSEPGIDLRDAWAIANHCVEAWNKARLVSLGNSKPAAPPVKKSELSRVSAELQAIFAPVLEHVARKQNYARMMSEQGY
jgi:hypothetical protein